MDRDVAVAVAETRKTAKRFIGLMAQKVSHQNGLG
jgi:hypothetical protein